ncbi:M14 family zinc carboxypeptidase [Desulfoluna spongiiphila]|uniref:carboxypeptidase T n=1 Tax=Desulfoluna spongiiphila TaxID=419481 RepID=A0A1G5C163_9BACT|nr:M14 family zinc carboxypeptidase [Desulfoluna spongiiphila]SCX96057.1 pre-peptidase C-terminal domain-containing protein [Desulfoluna spongiiphila]
MKAKCLCLFFASVFLMILGTGAFADQAEREESRRYIKAYFPDKEIALYVIKSFEPTPPEINYDEGFLVIHATLKDEAYLTSLGFRIEPHEGYILHRKDAAAPMALATQSADTISGYPCYKTVEATFSDAQAMVTAYPNLAEIIDAGDSWKKENTSGGYDLFVLKLTNKTITSHKPKLFITSAIHAREYTTSPLALAFAHQLTDTYQTDADSRWILDHHEVHLMLHANPDGRKQAEGGASWRKNNNTDYCAHQTPGADLNRNFDFHWGGSGASTYTCDQTYRGSHAASEPETQAVQNYMKAIFDDHNGGTPGGLVSDDASGLYIDIHSYSELVLWPWGDTSNAAPNGTQLQTLGRKFAYFNGYTPQQAVGLYPTTGTTDDYAYGELGIAGYCFELGTAFFQSCATYENQILPGNLPALLYAAKVARAPYKTPAGPDILSLSLDNAGTVTATAVDTRYSSANGTEASQAIAAAEYTIDTPPWAQGTVAHALHATDGVFNATSEGITGTVDTTGLTAGEHMVFVRAKDANNNWGAVSALFLTVAQPGAPTAAFTFAATDLTVQFSDQSSDANGSITSRAWAFGDGATSTQTNPQHTYAAAGSYTATLTVTDNDGLTAIDTRQIVVTADDGVPVITNGETLTGLAAAKGDWLYHKVLLPSGAANLTISISDGSGDADLYTRFGDKPTQSDYDCRPYKWGNNETCSNAAPSSGATYIGIRAYSAFSGVSLTVSYQ